SALAHEPGAGWARRDPGREQLQRDDLVDDAVVADALAVPVVVQVRALHGGGDEVRMEHGDGLAAAAAHAVVHHAVAAGGAPAAGGPLAGGVAVGVVQLRPAAADVMEAAVDVGQV